MRSELSGLKLLCLMLAGIILLGRPGLAESAAPGPVAQFHCAGYFALAVDTNLSALNQAFALPTAGRVRELAVSRSSKLIADGLGLGTNESAPSLIVPLLNDVLEAESLGSFGAPTDGPLNFILALRLDADRAQFWQSNLSQMLGASGEKVNAQGFDGWRWSMGPSDSYWMTPAKGWLIVGRGDGFLPLQAEYLQQVKSQGRPVPAMAGKWLEANIDWVRLGTRAPDWVRLLKPARMKLEIASENSGLNLTAHLVYPEDLPWKFDARPKPTDLVGSPLVSFTAGQDVAAYLNMGPNFSNLPGNPLTNQFCAWALREMPFQTYMAWPEVDASNVLTALSPQAVAAFNPALKEFNGTELLWHPDAYLLELSNLKVIDPAVGAVQRTNGEFLMLAVFPPPLGKQHAPDALWKQVNGRTNLVYYDWEETGARLQQWRGLGRMILTPRRSPSPYMGKARGLETKWMGDLSALQGQTVTEITRTAPNELSVVRQAPLGLTAIEIFLLSDWLSAVGAPSHPQIPFQ
jgi:hypothetical protein